MPNVFLCVSQLSLEGFTSWKCSHTWLVMGFFQISLQLAGIIRVWPRSEFQPGTIRLTLKITMFRLNQPKKRVKHSENRHPHHRNSSIKTTAFQRPSNTHLQTNKKLRHILSLNRTSHPNGSIVPPKRPTVGHRSLGIALLVWPPWLSVRNSIGKSQEMHQDPWSYRS